MEITLCVTEKGKNIVRVYDTEIVCDDMKDTLEQINWTIGEQGGFAIAYPERRKGELKEVLTSILKRVFGEDIADLQDKLHRRNMQIKDLKSQILSNIQVKGNLHSRIDVLEKIVKENNLWEVYCTACDNNK